MTSQVLKAAAKPLSKLPKRGTGHRYQAIARFLTNAITSGRYPVGSTLPTEHELCEKFGISRFTVREALRQLREGGLVMRKPRSGTTVIAAQERSPFVQSLDSLDDLLQYAATTELRILHMRKTEIDSSIAAQIPIPTGQRWLFGIGIRFRKEDNQPAALTRVYINPAFGDIARRLKDRSSAIYKLIETHYDVVVTRVEQRIFAASLTREDALQLQAKIGSPVLRVIRSYYDKEGRLVTASDSLHPADRFSYAMTINKSDIG
jgi:DNA-binding GntR family transcriptional regulator